MLRPGVFAIDLVCVLIFALVGRASHGESVAVVGVLRTAWPFLVGATLGFLAGRGHRYPTYVTSGLAVWAGAIVAGTLIRAWTGAGTPISFVIVTAVVLAVLILGWRGVYRAVLSVRSRRAEA